MSNITYTQHPTLSIPQITSLRNTHTTLSQTYHIPVRVVLNSTLAPDIPDWSSNRVGHDTRNIPDDSLRFVVIILRRGCPRSECGRGRDGAEGRNYYDPEDPSVLSWWLLVVVCDSHNARRPVLNEDSDSDSDED